MPPSDEKSGSRNPAFPPTKWTLIAAVQSDSEDARRAALEKLCTTYRYPIYCFLRRSGLPVEDAEDVTQDFLVRILERNSFAAADRERGKLRSWLLAILKFVLADRARERDTLKRGGGAKFDSYDVMTAEDLYAKEFRDDETPERIFERTSARAIIEGVLDELCLAYAKRGEGEFAAAARSFVVGQNDDTQKPEVLQKLGLTDGAFRAKLKRFRDAFKSHLQRRVQELVENPADLKAEIDAICRAYSR